MSSSRYGNELTGSNEVPACVQNAMMNKDKKPFTYTPGGIDLSQIKSERMAKRLARNAQAEGVPNKPSEAKSVNQSNKGISPAMGHCAIGVPFQVLPSISPNSQKQGNNYAPGPPPPPPPTGALPASKPNTSVKMSPALQKNEAPPFGMRPKIEIPPNPMAGLRKVPPPVEKNGFWKDEYIKERSSSPSMFETAAQQSSESLPEHPKNNNTYNINSEHCGPQINIADSNRNVPNLQLREQQPSSSFPIDDHYSKDLRDSNNHRSPGNVKENVNVNNTQVRENNKQLPFQVPSEQPEQKTTSIQDSTQIPWRTKRYQVPPTKNEETSRQEEFKKNLGNTNKPNQQTNHTVGNTLKGNNGISENQTFCSSFSPPLESSYHVQYPTNENTRLNQQIRDQNTQYQHPPQSPYGNNSCSSTFANNENLFSKQNKSNTINNMPNITSYSLNTSNPSVKTQNTNAPKFIGTSQFKPNEERNVAFGPKEHIIPIQLEESSVYVRSPGSTPGYISCLPNQFVDQGYNMQQQFANNSIPNDRHQPPMQSNSFKVLQRITNTTPSAMTEGRQSALNAQTFNPVIERMGNMQLGNAQGNKPAFFYQTGPIQSGMGNFPPPRTFESSELPMKEDLTTSVFPENSDITKDNQNIYAKEIDFSPIITTPDKFVLKSPSNCSSELEHIFASNELYPSNSLYPFYPYCYLPQYWVQSPQNVKVVCSNCLYPCELSFLNSKPFGDKRKHIYNAQKEFTNLHPKKSFSESPINSHPTSFPHYSKTKTGSTFQSKKSSSLPLMNRITPDIIVTPSMDDITNIKENLSTNIKESLEDELTTHHKQSNESVVSENEDISVVENDLRNSEIADFKKNIRNEVQIDPEYEKYIFADNDIVFDEMIIVQQYNIEKSKDEEQYLRIMLEEENDNENSDKFNDTNTDSTKLNKLHYLTNEEDEFSDDDNTITIKLPLKARYIIEENSSTNEIKNFSDTTNSTPDGTETNNDNHSTHSSEFHNIENSKNNNFNESHEIKNDVAPISLFFEKSTLSFLNTLQATKNQAMKIKNANYREEAMQHQNSKEECNLLSITPEFQFLQEPKLRNESKFENVESSNVEQKRELKSSHIGSLEDIKDTEIITSSYEINKSTTSSVNENLHPSKLGNFAHENNEFDRVDLIKISEVTDSQSSGIDTYELETNCIISSDNECEQFITASLEESEEPNSLHFKNENKSSEYNFEYDIEIKESSSSEISPNLPREQDFYLDLDSERKQNECEDIEHFTPYEITKSKDYMFYPHLSNEKNRRSPLKIEENCDNSIDKYFSRKSVTKDNITLNTIKARNSAEKSTILNSSLKIEKDFDTPKVSVRDRISAFEEERFRNQYYNTNHGQKSEDLCKDYNSLEKISFEIDEDDSGVTDMNKIFSETDTESECLLELPKRLSYQRATTHSRLFQLLQNENYSKNCQGEEDESIQRLKPSREKILHKVSITRKQNPKAFMEAETMRQRRERLSLPIKKYISIDADNPSSPNSPVSPATHQFEVSHKLNEKRINELIQNLRLK